MQCKRHSCINCFMGPSITSAYSIYNYTMGPFVYIVYLVYSMIMGPCGANVHIVWTLSWAQTILAYTIFIIIRGPIRLKCIHHMWLCYRPMQCKRHSSINYFMGPSITSVYPIHNYAMGPLVYIVYLVYSWIVGPAIKIVYLMYKIGMGPVIKMVYTILLYYGPSHQNGILNKQLNVGLIPLYRVFSIYLYNGPIH